MIIILTALIHSSNYMLFWMVFGLSVHHVGQFIPLVTEKACGIWYIRERVQCLSDFSIIIELIVEMKKQFKHDGKSLREWIWSQFIDGGSVIPICGSSCFKFNVLNGVTWCWHQMWEWKWKWNSNKTIILTTYIFIWEARIFSCINVRLCIIHKRSICHFKQILY